MFTGLVEEGGTIRAVEPGEQGARLVIGAAAVLDGLRLGDSVAVNGACLTAVAIDDDGFAVDAVAETLRRTSLGELRPGDRVNLERPMRLGDRLDGHLVQGHVDATGTVVAIADDGFARRVRIELPAGLERYVVERGSIALNGVSLTVAGIEERIVEVSLIPETLERTTFGTVAAGDPVNVEVDVIARHAERLLQGFEVSDGK